MLQQDGTYCEAGLPGLNPELNDFSCDLGRLPNIAMLPPPHFLKGVYLFGCAGS